MPKLPNGHWMEFANVEAAIRPVAEELGRMPKQKELFDRGLSSVAYYVTAVHGGFAEVQRRMGLDGIRRQRPNGYWNDLDHVRDAIAPLARRLGRMPTGKELQSGGNSTLVNVIQQSPGGFEGMAARLGLAFVHARHTSDHLRDFANVERILAPIVAELGRMPTVTELNARDAGWLRAGMVKYHGGCDAVGRRLGLPEPERKRRGHWESFPNVESALRPVIEELGRMPKFSELRARNMWNVGNAITKRFGGMAAVGMRLGINVSACRSRQGFWRNFANVEQSILSAVATHGRTPSSEWLRANGFGTAVTAIHKYHGGFASVIARLGLGPVTDETIATHADALATIVPTLDADPTVLWSRMKRSWTIRDLDAAVAAHATNGSLDAFRKLLDATAIPSWD